MNTSNAETTASAESSAETTVSHCAALRVRYADTDKMQIVYNGTYLTYFEVGRTELLRACGLPYSQLERDGYLLPVLEAAVQYKSPAYYDDVLYIYTSYIIKRAATIRLDYVIKRGETEIATGYTLHSFVDAKSMKPVRPPAVFFEAIAEYAESNFPELSMPILP
jgi:acyl-CoA thioester hydrolase